MNDVNIFQMVESEGSSYIKTQDASNTANAQAYLAPANMDPIFILDGKSLLIEPSVCGVPEPPSGGAAPQAKTPEAPKLEGAGGNPGSRPEGTPRAGGSEFMKSGGYGENKAQRNTDPILHEKGSLHSQNSSEKENGSFKEETQLAA